MDFPELLTKISELQDQLGQARAEWLKHVLSLAVGALAVLSALRPAAVTVTQSYLLAGTWLFLGAGIVAGAVATYLQIEILKRSINLLKDDVQRKAESFGSRPPRTAVFRVIRAPKTMRFAVPIMIITLLLAVCCLVGFSMLGALQGLPAVPNGAANPLAH
ncbi:hypothetical protein [Salinicola lusitanus]|uniref:hypothetical protein n=1 Tax=Salinicola lusitanus TaxID=1949085 RepID=UPI000DA146C8|nr:hypothetical protein [Salinicola lusitanus]